MIPEVFYAYWDGNPLSYLQYLTVVTFKKFNPNWKVVIYMPIKICTQKTWATNEQKAVYTGKNYLDDLFKLDVEIRKINFETIGFSNDVSEVYKADYIRYWILAIDGGLWSDMDIIYIEPIDNLFTYKFRIMGNRNKIDTVICYNRDHYPVGFFMASPGNKLFLELVANTKLYLNTSNYQSIGCKMLLQLIGEPENLTKKYPALNILLIDGTSYLPYDWDKIPDIFVNNVPANIKLGTIGIHWFNGSPISTGYQNLIDQKQLPTTGSIYPYIKEYLD